MCKGGRAPKRSQGSQEVARTGSCLVPEEVTVLGMRSSAPPANLRGGGGAQLWSGGSHWRGWGEESVKLAVGFGHRVVMGWEARLL